MEKIQRSISDKTINTVFQEDLIKDLVSTAISETLKDLKQQHKNSLALLTRQVEGNKKYYEEELKTLKDELEKFRNKLAAANDKCNKMEKRIKDKEHSITLQRSITKDEINHIKDEIIRIERPINEEIPTNAISRRSDDINTHDKQINNSDITLSQANEVVIDETMLENQSEVKDRKNDMNRDPKKSFVRSDKWMSDGKVMKKWSSDIVIIMDSNRKYLLPDKVFPGKKVTVLKCGNIISLNRIVDDPHFYDVESIIIHVGVNDVESELHPHIIADNLLKVSAKMKSKFPNSNIFLSEVTPRLDDFQRKVTHFNDFLKLKAVDDNLHLISRSNLQGKSLFYKDDVKHFHSSTGVRILAKNIKSKVFQVMNPSRLPPRNKDGGNEYKSMHQGGGNLLSEPLPIYYNSPASFEPNRRDTSMDSRVIQDQYSYANRVKTPIVTSNPATQRNVLSELMSQLHSMNKNLMHLTASFQSNGLPSGMGLGVNT